METLEQICFQIISSVGEARSSFIEAISYAREKKYSEVEQLMASGEAAYQRGHVAHAKLIQKEATGETSDVSLLLVHAEDQMMSAETFKIVANECIEIYKRIA